MAKPSALMHAPSVVFLLLGGAVATVLELALLNLVPLVGVSALPLPLWLGGMFSGEESVAFWIGHILFWLGGAFVLPVILGLFWQTVPGANYGFGGALVKGLSWGLILWAVSGLALGLAGWLNRAAALDPPGLFALSLGVGGALALLLAHLAYGVAQTLIATMGQGISPVETIGWKEYRPRELHQEANS
ncbi:MAG: hypothetical protein KY468_09655 [Armatimonadetes bacterium]|nr:hypothetical protein [Armatimonadota bacterium]